MQSEFGEGSSIILKYPLSNEEVAFFRYLVEYCQDKEDMVDIKGIDNNHSAVKDFFSPFITEFRDHKWCYRKCIQEEELTEEKQAFEGIPSGQCVLETGMGNATELGRYRIIKVQNGESVYTCKSLFKRNQVIHFYNRRDREMQQGSFKVLNQDPHRFSHTSCQKEDCVAQVAPCRGDLTLYGILDSAIGTNLGSFCEHPFYGFFGKKVLRTETNQVINRFCIKGRFVLDTWERYQRVCNKHIYNRREVFFKQYSHYIVFGLWAFGSGIYFKKNTSHSMRKKMSMSVAVGSLIAGGLWYRYARFEKN